MPRRRFAGLSAAAAAGVATGAVSGALPGMPSVASAASAMTTATPRSSATSGPAASQPTNVRVTDDAFVAHIEPVLAVNPRDPRNLLAACRVFQGPLLGVAAYASFDRGRTWRGHGMLPGLVPNFDGNPTVAFDSAGRGFVCAITDTTAQPPKGDTLIWRTDDGGRSFSPPVTAIAGGVGLSDHSWLVIPRRPASRSGGFGELIYIASRMYGTPNDGVVLARSLDGGSCFEPPRMVVPASSLATVAPVAAVGSDGTVCIAYFGAMSRSGTLQAVASTDHGETFTAPVDLVSFTSTGPALSDANVTIKSGPSLAASPHDGRFHAVMTTFDDATGDSRLLLVTSGRQARAWGQPVTLAAGTQAVYLQPQMAVDEHGRIAVSVYALSVAEAKIDVMMFLSEPGGAGFGTPVRVTTESFDPRQAIDTGATHWLGNYQGLAVGDGVFRPIWTDTRTGDAQIFTAAVPADAAEGFTAPGAR